MQKQVLVTAKKWLAMNLLVQGLCLVFLSAFFGTAVGQNNPCPQIFQYQPNEYSGIITIPATSRGTTIVSASMAVPGRIFDRSTGGLKLRKNLNAAVADATRGQDIQYVLSFPRSTELPIITAITLNNQEICGTPGFFNLPSWSFQHQFSYPSGATYLSTPVRTLQTNVGTPPPPVGTPPPPVRTPPPPVRTIPPPVRTPPPPVGTPPPPVFLPVETPTPPTRRPDSDPDSPSWLSTYPLADQCGFGPDSLRMATTHLIIGGQPVQEGEYPWLVALFHLITNGQQQTREYKCGGTLISQRYVITAAHCVSGQSRVFLELGKFNVNNYDEEGYIIRNPQQIIRHPDYLVNTGHGDVALILIEPVQFTNKIKPICLWPYGLQFDSFLRGTISGWGRAENGGDVSDTPMQLAVDIVSLQTCRNSHEELRRITSEKTFCAGGQSKGPCHGDSGSGFYIKQRDRWYLRGIISVSIGNEFVCNLNEYAVYVDISYYLDWLKSYLS